MLRLLLRYHGEMKIDFVNRDNTDSSVCIAPTHWPPSGSFFPPSFWVYKRSNKMEKSESNQEDLSD